MENRLTLAGSHRLPAQFDVFGEAGLGNREGDNVGSNLFRRGGGGVGFNPVARAEDQPLSLFRLSTSAYYFGFDQDRFGFGGASLLDRRGLRVPPNVLGSDGLPTAPSDGVAGVGGYFSPSRFVSGVGRIEARGRPSPSVEYRIALFVGTQTYTGSTNRTVEGFSGDLTIYWGKRISLPLSATWDNVGPFHQLSLSARLSGRF